jgi:hypothetical protein
MIVRIAFVLFLPLGSCALQTMGMHDGAAGEGTTDPDAADVLEFIDRDDVTEDDPVDPDQPVEVEDIEEIEYPWGWLPGWGNRVRLAIDPGDIDEGLQDFPLLVHLGARSGIGPVDMSCVFHELRIDSNHFKIAVTDGDTNTELFVEIERWDSAGEEAWLWAKVPYVDDGVETVLYVYFDAHHPDNKGWVNETDSDPAREVWNDGAYAGVWHLAALGGLGSVKDSTLNRRNGTPHGSMSAGTDLGKSPMGGAIHFDGIDDYVDVGNIESNNWGTVTLEAWFTADSIDDDRLVCKASADTLSAHVFSLGTFRNGSNRFLRSLLVTDGPTGDQTNLESDAILETGVWTYGAFAWSGDDGMGAAYINGQHNQVATNDGETLANSAQSVCIGNINNLDIAGSDKYFEGRIDEVRISSVRRSDAWLKATYEGGVDDLVTFGSLETFP